MRTYSHWIDDTEEFTLCGRLMNDVPPPQIAVFKDEITCVVCNDEVAPRASIRKEAGVFAALDYPITDSARDGLLGKETT